MAAFVKRMMVFLVAAAFQQGTALSVAPFHTSNFFDPAKNWMGEATLRELFDDDTVDQLQENGFIKTRQNPDYPDRTQYFVVKTPADADLIYTECLQKADGENLTAKNQEEEEYVQNFGKEWINTEKLREQYGDDGVEKLVRSGYLEKRQHPDFPEQTQLGKIWISTQNLLEKYGFDKVEELLKSGRVEKRQNPRCPERTQYFVKDASASSEQSAGEEEDQEPEESKVKRHAEAKVQKHGKAKNRDALHQHADKDVKDKEATAQKQGEPNGHSHEKKHKHKGKLHQHDDKVVDVQKHGNDADQKHDNKEDVDGVVGDDKEKSAAIPTRLLTTVVAIAASVFFV